MDNNQTFGIYIIGDEILSGKRMDKHLSQAIQILKSRGLTLAWAEYVGDDPARLIASFKRSLSTNDIVFSFGGIGATPDDFTRQAVADALSVPTERHAGAVAEIKAQFGEGAYPKRVLMADFPQGSALIPNPINRVAGFSVGLPNNAHTHYFLPGFPQMAWPMMEWVLDTHYSHLFHTQTNAEISIKVLEVGESQLIDLMNSILQKYQSLKLFSLPSLSTDRLSPGKSIELGLKGDLANCQMAMREIQAYLDAHQMAWQALS